LKKFNLGEMKKKKEDEKKEDLKNVLTELGMQ